MIAAVSTALLNFPVPIKAASQQDWPQCSGQDPAVAIQACSRIISDQATAASDRSDGYLFRAGASLSQQNFDLAIADYSEAIRLSPKSVTGYTGRALAYFHKGNRDQAAADFATVRQLDPSKAAELAAGDPDLKQIATLASALPAGPIETKLAAKSFPRDLGLPKAVLDYLEASPIFAKASPVALKSLDLDFSGRNEWSGQITNSSRDAGKSHLSVTPLAGELVTFDFLSNSEAKTTAPGKAVEISHSTMHNSGVSFAGLFDLDFKMSFENDGRLHTSETKLQRIDNMTGTVFPMQLNNHFSIATTSVTTGGKSPNQSSAETDCVVSRMFDARSFHPSLSGKAFLWVCENFNVENGSIKLAGRETKIFVEQLGYWIHADPVSPSEHLMNSEKTETITAANSTHKSSGSMVLTSVALQP